VILKPSVASVALRADNLAGVFSQPLKECQAFIDHEAGADAPLIGAGFTRIDLMDAAAAERFAARFRDFVARPHEARGDGAAD